MKILIGSSIYQKYDILKEFLISLKELKRENLEIHYIFIDDNEEEKSSKLLLDFQKEEENVVIYEGNKNEESYVCDEYSHYWSNKIVDKVTKYKNFIISEGEKNSFDYLFLIDSDIVLHENTLLRLISTKRDIVSNIFWTRWNPDGEELPQVWQEDSYSFYTIYNKENFTTLDGEIEKIKFFEMLRNPGNYKVGGLGACTLISKKVLQRKEVNFSRLYNLSFWGEDRHFSMRAVANGFTLYVDTYYPAYHIYRYENLAGVKEYKENNKTRGITIIGEQLFYFAKEALKRLNSFNCEKESEEYKLFFTKEGGELASKTREGKAKSCTSGSIFIECEVLDFNMNFNKEITKLSGEITYCEKGFKEEKSFYKEFLGELEIQKLQGGMWRISKFKEIKELKVLNPPVVRNVKENPKLTLSMVVKNEGERYLRRVLEKAKEYIDEAVIIDDGSTDNTKEIIREVLKEKKLTLIENESSTFSTEWILRKQQWEETLKTNPDWIIFLDADEIFEEKFKVGVKELIKNRDVDCYSFRLFDMWSENYFRADKYWYAHRTYRPFLIRYQENFEYTFKETNQHCGRMPLNVKELPSKISGFRLKHYGWAKEEDRTEKYNRYKLLDPESKYGVKEQYDSILDEKPKLEKWIE